MKTKSKKIILSVLCFILAVMTSLGLGAINTAFADVTDIKVTGVSLRLTTINGYYGLCYSATIPSAEYSENTNYGIEIVPEDLKEDSTKIQSVNGIVKSDGKNYVMEGFLLNILPANTSRPFTARAFKEVDGQKVYSEWIASKSIFTVATQALADETETYEGEALEFLQNTVKTVFGIDSNLTGKYVLNNYEYEDVDGNPIDINLLAKGDTFTVKMDVVKENDPTKVLKAYPTVDLVDSEGNIIEGGLEQVEGTQDTYTVMTNIYSGVSLRGSVADEVINVTTCSGVAVTDNQDGSHSVIMQPGRATSLSVSGLMTMVDIGSRTTYVNNYYSIGEYGVGYEFVTEFKGNNMPQIMIFANAANSQMAAGYNNGSDVGLQGQTGYILMNGWCARSGWAGTTGSIWQDYLNVYGPNRMGGIENNYNGSTILPPTTTNLTTTENTDITTTASTALSEDITYRYSVRTRERTVSDVTTVWIFVSLKNAETGAVVYSGCYNTNKTVAEIEAQGKTVVFYAGIKGDGIGTEFTYYTPNNGVIVIDNQDGTYDVKMIAGSDTGYMNLTGTMDGVSIASRTTYKNNYHDIGEYGVGYEFVTEFKGNNMPQVLLFANEANSQMAGGYNNGSDIGLQGQTGYMIMNGYAGCGSNWGKNTSVMYTDFLTILGPNRMGNLSNNYNFSGVPTDTSFTVTGNASITSTASTALSNDITYRYDIITEEVGGEVCISVSLTNADTGAIVFNGYYNTGKSTIEIEELGKHVVFYAGVKGNAVNTDFTYYTPELVS